MYINRNHIQKILIIQFRPIGDVLLSTPLIRILRKEFPTSHIAFLAEPVPAEVLENNENLNEIILYHKVNVSSSYRFFKSLENHQFDLVVDLLGSPGTAWAAFFTKAPYRLGYDIRVRKYAYNIRTSRNIPDRYTALKKLALLKSIGIESETDTLTLNLRESERQFAEMFLKNSHLENEQMLVCVSPTSKRQARRWLPYGYSRLIDLLQLKYKMQVLLLWGGNSERDYVQQIADDAQSNPILIPETSVRQMAAIIERCRLFIGNCNGPKHIAHALGLPSVSIYGPTDETVWNPSDRSRHPIVKGNVPCIHCSLQTCFHQTCMALVKPEDIEQAMLSIEEIKHFLEANNSYIHRADTRSPVQ